MSRETKLTIGLILLWISACILALLLVVPSAHAQASWQFSSRKSASETHGTARKAWSTSATEILAGTLVMSDTMGVTNQAQVAYGKGFTTWSGVPADTRRILGILINTTPGYGQGYILTQGSYFGAKMTTTGVAAGTVVRPSFTVAGALAAWVASDSAATNRFPLGIFQRYVSGTSTNGWVDFDIAGRR